MSQSAFAADLIDVYCQAVKCDPTFKAAMAQLMANRQDIPINHALLLPRLDIHGEAERQHVNLEGLSFANFQSTGVFIPVATSRTFYNNSVYYYLKLSQPVFNYKGWAKLEQAKASVKQSEAAFCASAQDLMVRTVRAYFDVLIADADLFYTREQKKAVAEQLRQSQIEFKVGTVPQTNVFEARANYDIILAQEVSDQYELAKRIEHLRTITGNLYCSIQGLSAYLPLIKPQPMDINAWVCTAEKQDYQLLAARYASIAAQQNIKVQASDRLPVINAYGEYEYNYESNYQGSGIYNKQKGIEAGVQLDWSPIQGGAITARTMQARYLLQKTCQDQEFTYRQVVANTRNAFLGIFAGIGKVIADRAAIYSSQQSLKATTESYKAGLRTILDVLNQETQLYQAQKDYARDRYNYIYQTVLLKQAAGTLTVCDLQHINSWLYSHIDISKADAFLDGSLPAR